MVYYLILLITALITMAAQGYISKMYKKTKEMMARSNMSGYDVVRKILDKNGLDQVKIAEVEGVLSDHYDPTTKTVSLSKDIYHEHSLASISVAAHECGHAIQDKEGYAVLTFRRKIIPLVNFASKAGYIIIAVSIFASLFRLLWIGILMEFIILLFQVVTLPVEFNASSRALTQISELRVVTDEERRHCEKMLKAAALTYVASVAAAILEILRLVLLAARND